MIGKKLENLFSVTNMQKAYNNLKKNNINGRAKELEIRATHLYVRFLPKDIKQYDILIADTTLFLEDYPIDYKRESAADFYHDPSIADSLPTYQYTAVPVGFATPESISMEVLEELYLPKADDHLSSPNGKISSEFEDVVDELEYEAFLITNNLTNDEKKSNAGRAAGWLSSKHTPRRTIQVRDSRLGIIRLNGGKVRTRRWFEVHEAITNYNGDYVINGTYRYDFNYDIIWERAGFDIRSGTFVQARMDGPNCKCNWSPTIENGVQRFYASVFRGAERYFNGNIGGLRSPQFLFDRMKISAYDKDGDTNGVNWGNWDGFGIIPDIQIWRFVFGRERETDEIFSTVVHEIAHTTHLQVMNAGHIQYSQVSKIIFESWAVAVQWHITSMEYRVRGIANYGTPTFFNGINGFRVNFGYQYWFPELDNTSREYTSLFIDIVDNDNQMGMFFNAISDNLTGYTLSGIESGFLKHVYGVSSLRDKLKANKPALVTDAQIDELLNNF